MVIPNFVQQALAGDPITVFGDGSQSRAFCHVGDVVGALAALIAEPRAIGEVINIGNTEEITMTALALPVVVVARTTLGTINHTVLTIEALRHRALVPAVVVMVGVPNADNRDAIERYGAVPVLATLPWLDDLTGRALDGWLAQDPEAARALTEVVT